MGFCCGGVSLCGCAWFSLSVCVREHGTNARRGLCDASSVGLLRQLCGPRFEPLLERLLNELLGTIFEPLPEHLLEKLLGTIFKALLGRFVRKLLGTIFKPVGKPE